MMYGFGDEKEPLEDSVTLVEDMLIDYISYLVRFIQELLSCYRRSFGTICVLLQFLASFLISL